MKAKRDDAQLKPWDAKRVEREERKRPLQPCVNCGTPSRNRWCSTGCFEAEDGPHE